MTYGCVFVCACHAYIPYGAVTESSTFHCCPMERQNKQLDAIKSRLVCAVSSGMSHGTNRGPLQTTTCFYFPRHCACSGHERVYLFYTHAHTRAVLHVAEVEDCFRPTVIEQFCIQHACVRGGIQQLSSTDNTR